MRIKLLLALAVFPAMLSAQERVTVRGRVVNRQGESIEYVQLGMPGSGIGTISTVDGRFEIEVPSDTLEFHHVSYQTGYYPVSGPADDVIIVLKDSELPPAVFIGGNTKEKYLLRPGTRFPGAEGGFDARDGIDKGKEVGSVAKARKPFLIKDILFTITSNRIPGCVVSINIYRIEGEPKEFINILHKPIYADVAVSDSRQDFDIRPEESILLEPGSYFISFSLVDCDMDAVRRYQETPESERTPTDMQLYTNIYFKSSYYRESSLAELNYIPINIGISVKGLEYQ
jgi:hypothetical protein